ncbi:hypothetical protein PWY87_10020 [Kribbella solani]|uniref:hypothetical protein n=1 Tax=Kribbella solani TaxID=236067 RepID=UPI0029B76D6C|nr:hypothetical protein [Kribbella solani]MDX2971216.1 hypothetical protein [Kribbella solani]MDX3002005.1 hypothetical protein [Kribbella solani]
MDEGFYSYLSGLDNLRLVAEDVDASRERIDEVVELAGLGGCEQERFSTYTPGMKRRLRRAAELLVGLPETSVHQG